MSSSKLTLPGNVAYLVLLLTTCLAAFWGVAEFFHEGWFAPYGRYLIFYMLPWLLLAGLTLVGVRFPLVGGGLISLGGIAFAVWRGLQLRTLHVPLSLSFWITAFLLVLPGLLLLWDGWLRKGRPQAPAAVGGFKAHWRSLLPIVLPLGITLGVGTPLLVRNLKRLPLEHYGEVTVEADALRLTFAGDGPGWLYSNRHPIVFEGRTYSGLSWNEIALFGLEPIGFEGKRYGPTYAGTPESIYYATQEDFARYNLFRYINCAGTELTDTVHDCWRLPTVEEYVRIFTFRGENAGGVFDPVIGKVHYRRHAPEKEAPIWAPEQEVIYYWTATCGDRTHAYDVSYSGRVRLVLKTTCQDYRGFRAVRVPE